MEASSDNGRTPREEVRLLHSDDQTLIWLPILYSEIPEISAQSRLVGVSIVAKVNVFTRSERDGSSRVFGNYAAYMGVCSGFINGEDGADYIARHGEKVSVELAEILFRDHIDAAHGTNNIEWRP